MTARFKSGISKTITAVAADFDCNRHRNNETSFRKVPEKRVVRRREFPWESPDTQPDSNVLMPFAIGGLIPENFRS